MGLTVTSYLHSSVAKLSEEAEQLKESLGSFKPPIGVPVVHLRLIWKNSKYDMNSESIVCDWSSHTN